MNRLKDSDREKWLKLTEMNYLENNEQSYIEKGFMVFDENGTPIFIDDQSRLEYHRTRLSIKGRSIAEQVRAIRDRELEYAVLRIMGAVDPIERLQQLADDLYGWRAKLMPGYRLNCLRAANILPRVIHHDMLLREHPNNVNKHSLWWLMTGS